MKTSYWFNEQKKCDVEVIVDKEIIKTKTTHSNGKTEENIFKDEQHLYKVLLGRNYINYRVIFDGTQGT